MINTNRSDAGVENRQKNGIASCLGGETPGGALIREDTGGAKPSARRLGEAVPAPAYPYEAWSTPRAAGPVIPASSLVRAT